MRSLKSEIAALLLDDFDLHSPPQPFANVLLDYAQRVAPEYSELELAENLLERRQKEQYRSYLSEKQRQEFLEGHFCPYDILDASDQIIGYCVPRARDSELMARRRQIAPHIPIALETLRHITPNQFEAFGRRLLRFLRAEEAYVTPQSGDEGVDFYGWLSLPETLITVTDFPSFRSEFSVFVLGQAKHYDQSRPISTSYIRELVGATALFRHDQLSPWQSRHQVPSIKLMSPILPLIITTGRVSQDARDLAKKSGVVTKDGPQIVEFLCLEGVGIREDAEGTTSFDAADFLTWLDD